MHSLQIICSFVRSTRAVSDKFNATFLRNVLFFKMKIYYRRNCNSLANVISPPLTRSVDSLFCPERLTE